LKDETVTSRSFRHICTEMGNVRSTVLACHPSLFIAVSDCKQIPWINFGETRDWK